MLHLTTHRNEVSGGGWLSTTVAMPLELAIGFAKVEAFLRISYTSQWPRVRVLTHLELIPTFGTGGHVGK
jgi:hypothetical protein